MLPKSILETILAIEELDEEDPREEDTAWELADLAVELADALKAWNRRTRTQYPAG
ncbi:MAG TPA: hypothetical protein VJL28_02105 [Gemmatimonadaceae bacterium]|nr:hypothetical protein [Gemmatimonadaceae bacterium]